MTAGTIAGSRRQVRVRPGRIALYAFVSLLAVIWLVPIVGAIFASFRPFAETLRAGNGREDAPGIGQQRPPFGVEVVRVLVMAQEHGVDRQDLRGRYCRLLGLRQRDVREPILAGRIEGGVGDEAIAIHLDQGRWTADQGDLHAAHATALRHERTPCPAHLADTV